MSLTNTQLKTLSERMNFPLAEISFKDELPAKLEFNKGYIINNEDAVDEDGKPNGGSHWTCLQINQYPKSGEGYYREKYSTHHKRHTVPNE